MNGEREFREGKKDEFRKYTLPNVIVSVGVQLLLNPSVLYLDEPTTGLDAFTSLALIETLKNLCKRGRTICLSIHQPSTNAFHLFDQVVLLTRGRLAYAGPVPEVVPYFTRLGFTIPLHQNPADWLIDITSVDNRTSEAEVKSLAQVELIIKSWADNDELLLPLSQSDKPSSENNGASTFNQVLVLSSRTARNLLQDRLMTIGALLEVVIVTAVVGYIFFRLEETQVWNISL